MTHCPQCTNVVPYPDGRYRCQICRREFAAVIDLPGMESTEIFPYGTRIFDPIKGAYEIIEAPEQLPVDSVEASVENTFYKDWMV